MSEETIKGAVKAAPLSDEQAKIAVLEKENADLKSELTDAVEVIQDLKDQLKSSGTAKGPIGKVGKQKYRIVGGFRTKDKVFTPQDIASNSKLIELLVSKGSTLVEKIQ